MAGFDMVNLRHYAYKIYIQKRVALRNAYEIIDTLINATPCQAPRTIPRNSTPIEHFVPLR